MQILKQITACALVAMTGLTVSAVDLGYSNGTINRTDGFRAGTATEQGMAVRLPASKLTKLRGVTITGVSAVFGSSRTDGSKATFFVTTDPTATPLVSETFDIKRAAAWVDVSFSKGYTITGDEPELYIGYTATCDSKLKLLMSDGADDLAGAGYILADGKWVDLYGTGRGAANVRAKMSDTPDFTDLLLKPINIEAYYKAGQTYESKAQVFNFGTQTINSFDIRVSPGNAATQTVSVKDVEIKPGECYNLPIEGITSLQYGNLDIDIEIVNVNGGNDADPADNLFAGNIFFYPATMERALLFEGFTGQECGNCPSGHSVLHGFMNAAPAEPQIIEVMHHAGYQPDFFTMKADGTYTLFYNSSSTYAPAIMVNRSVVPMVGSVPVMNTSEKNLNEAWQYVTAQQPYASMSLNSDFNADTRNLKVDLTIHTHNNMPSEQNVLNVFLVQDGLVGYQSGAGSAYNHNSVFRGTLPESPWGVLLNPEATKAGGEATYSVEVQLPQAIFSDYWEGNANVTDDTRSFYEHEIVPENMWLVAYVGAYNAQDVAGHAVYNCVRVPLGGNYTQAAFNDFASISPVVAPDVEILGAEGSILVSGNYDSVAVYDLAGRSLGRLTGLECGVYVVNVRCGDNVITRKVAVK